MFKNPYFRVALFTLLLAAGISVAGGIKSWNSGDTLSPTDLNANFAHIHNSMVGGHGARLVDADVSASANIAYAKVQNGRGIARAFVRVAPACTVGTCTMNSSFNVTSVAFNSTGTYTLTLAYVASNTAFVAVAQSETSAASCQAIPTSTTTVIINCRRNEPTAAAENDPFDVVVYDND